MRISLRLGLILVLLSGHALAAKGKKATADKPAGATMDTNDPADKETSDHGPFAPAHKTPEEGATQSEGDNQGETEGEAKPKKAEAEVAPIEDVKRRPRDKVVVYANVLIGFGGTAPEPGPPLKNDANKGTSATFMVGGRYDVSPAFSLGLRVPWTTANVRGGDGITAASQALGTPELMGEYRVTLSPRTLLPIDFGLGIPVAQGNYDTVNGQPQLRQSIVNDFADAAAGYRDGELFGPKRLPIVLGVGIDYQGKALSLHAATKFVAGIKTGGTLDYSGEPFNADPTEGSYQLKSVMFRNVTSAGIGYQVLDKPALTLALDSWVVTNAVDNVAFNSNDNVTNPSPIQVVFEPRLGARFGKISPSLGYIFPIGGRLADNHISGLELHCDVGF
ncbi:MAG TPA: hypothetical protein VHV51_01680 [Polyangiaceae bacterium]|jgi:hypothetical protein|nr:hypothetical protein [Polyangiaceae bacterium]